MKAIDGTRALLWMSAALATAGCHVEKKLHRFDVLVSALTDNGQPVAGAGVRLNGRDLGHTSAEGGLEITLSAYEGKVIRLHTVCPEGYRTRGEETELKLRRFAIFDASDRNRLHVAVECRPVVRQAAVLVRAGQANVPVLKGGVEIARTDLDGLAHILVTTAPRASFQLTLDTSQAPRLRPRSPTATFTMADSDRVFVFEQDFDLLPVERKPRVRRKVVKPAGPVEFKSVGTELRSWRPRDRGAERNRR